MQSQPSINVSCSHGNVPCSPPHVLLAQVRSHGRTGGGSGGGGGGGDGDGGRGGGGGDGDGGGRGGGGFTPPSTSSQHPVQLQLSSVAERAHVNEGRSWPHVLSAHVAEHGVCAHASLAHDSCAHSHHARRARMLPQSLPMRSSNLPATASP